jgi:hypothetical protein
VLVCSERKVLLAGCWWLVCSERKVLLAGKPSEQGAYVTISYGVTMLLNLKCIFIVIEGFQ